MKKEEDIEAVASRDLMEETGKGNFKILKKLGVVRDYIHPIKKEVHTRHFFLAEVIGELPEQWEGQEKHDGLKNPTRFQFFWLPLSDADKLIADQGSFLQQLG